MEKRAEWWVYISARNRSDIPSELTDQLTEHGIAWCDGRNYWPPDTGFYCTKPWGLITLDGHIDRWVSTSMTTYPPQWTIEL